MTYHFSANLPTRGVGILSDSVVSTRDSLGNWTKRGNNPKTFVISRYAAIACAGDATLCSKTVSLVCEGLPNDAIFSQIVPKIQKAYKMAAELLGYKPIELILAARTKPPHCRTKLIKYTMKKSSLGLRRIEDRDHYTAGQNLPDLEKELCSLLTVNYIRTGVIEDKLGNFLSKASHIVQSPKSFPLRICFSALMPVVEEYIKNNNLNDVVGSPWTILLLPEDGEIHFESSQMYDGSESVQPHQVLKNI